MTWDWKKANGVGGDSAAATLTGDAAPRRSSAGKNGDALATTERVPSIAWRTGASGYGLPGGGVTLLDECDHECPFCHGRGEIASGSICPVCNGRKTVHVHPPSVRCAFCGGQGQMPPRSNLTCWVCKGKGLVSVAPPVQACPDCQGRGRKPCQTLYCPRCKGVGAVRQDEAGRIAR